MTDESQGGPVPFGFPEDWPRSGVHQSVAGCTPELRSLRGGETTNRRNDPVVLGWPVEKEDQSYRLWCHLGCCDHTLFPFWEESSCFRRQNEKAGMEAWLA